MEVAKAGWLYKQSSVLHRWKKKWFVLDVSGTLHMFKSPETRQADDYFVLRACCFDVKTGSQVEATPPDSAQGGTDCLLQLNMRDGVHLVLSAESDDDAKTWYFTLEDARVGGVNQTAAAPPPPGWEPAVYHQQRPPPPTLGPTVIQQAPAPVIGSGFVYGAPMGMMSNHGVYGRYGHGGMGTTTYANPYTGKCESGDFCGRVISAPTPGTPVSNIRHSNVMVNNDGSKTVVYNPDGQTVYLDDSLPNTRRGYRRHMDPQLFQPM